ncbi:methyltransferase [Candidatus Woesearchaeota archaeon]|nr:methyltransferase [Candidatus Woesearchaeota archaeon]
MSRGCGNGILGFGALLLGCPEVIFVESEDSALEICRINYEHICEKYERLGRVSFLCQDVKDFDKKVKTIVENPPFGTKTKHIDRVFLEKAMECADVVYTMHKTSTKMFIDKLIDEKGFRVTDYFEHAFPIKASMEFHKKPKKNILVGVWRVERGR